MGDIFTPSTTGGRVLYVHQHSARPRYSQSPLVNGEDVVTFHGYEQKIELVGRFYSYPDIEVDIQANETNGYVREDQPNVSFDIGPSVGLYKFNVTLKRFVSSNS